MTLLLNELALDALESLKRTQNSSLLWQRVAALIDALAGNERAALVDALAALPLKSREAQWLRCSALACMTRDPVWFARQAELTDETFTADAVMTLLGLAWHHAVVRTSGHQAFAGLLQSLDAPRLQRLVAADMLGAGPAQRGMPGARLRVAIYTPEVGSSRHGGTTFTLNMLSVLARQGVDLHAFSAKEVSIPTMGSYHGGAESLTALEVDVESLKLTAPGAIQFSFPNVNFSLRARFNQVLQAIEAYKPDVVIFVGLMSPLVYRLYECYPVIGLCVHALPPVAPVDVWLSADPQADAACWAGVPVPQVFSFPFRFWPVGPVQPAERVAAGLPAVATVLVTAGGRLTTEIVPPWSTQMLAFLETHPAVHWLLVGVPEGRSLAALPSHPRIHLMAPQPRLEPWLAMCDIYVNPPRLGGGGALAMAMEQGMAVATFSNSDGGDKVGGFALDSAEAYFAQLSAWVSDPVARQEAGGAMKARFHARLDVSSEAAAQGLMQACQLAMSFFNQRMETKRA